MKSKKIKKFHPAFSYMKNTPDTKDKRCSINRLNATETPEGFASHYEPFRAMECIFAANYDAIERTSNNSSDDYELTSQLAWNVFVYCLELESKCSSGNHATEREILTPTLAINKELIDLFAKTELPDDLGLSDIPWDYGVVFFDKNMMEGKFKDFPCWLAFHKEPYIDDPNTLVLMYGFPIAKEYFVFDFAEFSSGVSKFGICKKEDPTILCSNGHEYADAIYKVFANFLAYASTAPIEELSIHTVPKSKGFGTNPRQDTRGRSVRLFKEIKGKNERTASGRVNTSHSSPRTHWRRGHWRRVPCGEQRLERRLSWIKPVLVNV